MKKNMGIWLDTKQAVVVKLINDETSVKKIESNIDTREREPGESKKYGRFGNQYLTYEKNRENRRNEQTNLFIKNLLKEIQTCDSLVLFGPSKMKYLLEKEVIQNTNLANKLNSVHKSKLLTDNQMVAWVKDFYKN